MTQNGPTQVLPPGVLWAQAVMASLRAGAGDIRSVQFADFVVRAAKDRNYLTDADLVK